MSLQVPGKRNGNVLKQPDSQSAMDSGELLASTCYKDRS